MLCVNLRRKPDNTNQKNMVIYSQALDIFRKQLSGVAHKDCTDTDEVCMQLSSLSAFTTACSD